MFVNRIAATPAREDVSGTAKELIDGVPGQIYINK